MANDTCAVEGCEANVRSKGWCSSHYQRWRNHGDPTAGRKSPQPSTTCAVEGCGRGGKITRGWCATHYAVWRRHGDPLGRSEPQSERECRVDGCARPCRTRGWCDMHYQRVRIRGDAGAATPKRVVGGDEAGRFWAKVDRRGPDDCWEWRGSVWNGYGQFRSHGITVRAHRYAYELLVGPIPDETLDHLCRNRACVNAEHLEPVSAVENARRGESVPAVNARKTHCKRGHEFTPENTYVWKPGHRACKTCARARPWE